MHQFHKTRDNAERKRRMRERALARQTEALGRSPGPCEICGAVVERPHFDHDHRTGLPRGWLCPNCNKGLGLFQDDPGILERAAAYLRAHT